VSRLLDTIAPWDAGFDRLLRSELRGLDPRAELDPDLPLTHHGVTSLGYVQLGRALAERYGIDHSAFGDRAFRTPRSLWAFVLEHRRAPWSLAQRFAESARRYPHAPCLLAGGQSLTYLQLARAAAALAARLPTARRVAVLGERELPLYRAYLAALYAGAAVAPLSLDAPPERNADIIAGAGIDTVLCTAPRDDPDLRAQLAAIAAVAAPVVLDGLEVPEGDSIEPDSIGPDSIGLEAIGLAPVFVAADQLAYLIFTSGSTGWPKAVGITHANVASFLDTALPRFRIGPGDVVSQSHGLTFDMSVFELWGAWSSGAALAVVPRIQALAPAHTLPRLGVTVWAGTPSLVDTALRAGRLPAAALPGVRHVVLGGEALTPATVAAVRAAAPKADIDNVYGPTEATVWVTTHRIAVADPVPVGRTVPIGTPLPTTTLRVSDSGELLVHGPQVFGGYLDPAADEGRFVELDGRRWYRTGDLAEVDESGSWYYRGRADGQVKVRGYRIELGEIEHVATLLLAGVRTAAVRTTNAHGEAQLVLFVETLDVDESALRLRLARYLPDYMVPVRVRAIERFTLTAHGKLDRCHLAGVARDSAVP
jgi:amino acid adenylation domain-containing protein